MSVDLSNKYVRWMSQRIQHYNPQKYWHYRELVVNPLCRRPKWLKIIYLIYIKRCDAYNNATMATNINSGAYFKSSPNLPHGLNGIIVHPKAIIGENCTIYQQVTIGGKNGSAAIIGNNVIIGAGAKIIGGVTIGNNVTIGANTVVTKDIPDDSTVVGAALRIISK